MASPTVAECETMLKNAVKILDEQRLWGGVSATNLLSLIDTFEQSLEGDYIGLAMNGVNQLRARNADAVALAADILGPILIQYAKAAGFAERNVQDILTRLYVYFIDNTKSIKTRAFSFGSVSAGGGNVGTGTLRRLTKDWEDEDIEACTPEAKGCKVIRDRHMGASVGEEIAEIYGAARNKDDILIAGSGRLKQDLKSLSAKDTLKYFGNPSFDTFSGTTAVPTAIADWTLNSGTWDGTKVQMSTSTYRTYDGAPSTAYSLRMMTNDFISQAFTNKRAIFPRYTPVHVQLAYNREAHSGDGNLTLTFGAHTAVVALAAETGWNVLQLPLTKERWLEEFDATTPLLKVELDSNTTGDVLIDDITIGLMSEFDGSYWALVGGATPFKVMDSFTATDSATDSKIQHWLWRAFGRYLPHDASPSVTDP